VINITNPPIGSTEPASTKVGYQADDHQDHDHGDGIKHNTARAVKRHDDASEQK
jgi:hypothetical protein